MNNNRKTSILLIFIIGLFITSCSDGLFSSSGQNKTPILPPSTTENPEGGTISRPTPDIPDNPGTGGTTTPPTPENPDSGVTPPTPENPDSGVTPPTPENPDSGVTPPTPENPDGGGTPPTPENPDGGIIGGVEMNKGDYIGGSGSGGPFPSCDPLTAERPIKRLIIAGASDRKIYYSDDNGITWTRSIMPTGLADTHAWQAFEDLGNDIVLAGSSGIAVSGVIDFGGGLGILKSTDGGKSWRKTNIINEPTKGLKVRDFLHIGKGIVIAAADITSDGGIWRSTDYGETWVQNVHKNQADFGRTPETADGINLGITSGLALVPDGRILVTRSQQVSNGEGGSFLNPVYFSEDKGLTWYSPVNIGHTDLIARGSGETIVLHNGNVVMAGQANGSIPYSSGKLIRWGWPEVALSAFGVKRSVGFESITELRDGTVIAGGFSVSSPNKDEIQIPGIWRSITSGTSYSQVFDSFAWRSVIGLDNCDVIAACMSMGFEGLIESSKSECNGLYKSTNRGVSWSKMSGLNGLEITSIIGIRKTQ